MSDERREDKGPEARKRRGRIVIGFGLFLLVLDLVTLVFAVAVFVNQSDFNDRVEAVACRNSGILIQGLQREIDQSKNTDLYAQFFPDIPKDQLDSIIKQQTTESRNQIQALTGDCTEGQLAAGLDP